MKSGRERLRDWIDRSKLNQREASEVLGCHDVVLSQWLSGARTPGLDNAHRIEDITGISTESWRLTDLSTENDADGTMVRKRKVAGR